jgi:hypothetical protein
LKRLLYLKASIDQEPTNEVFQIPENTTSPATSSTPKPILALHNMP